MQKYCEVALPRLSPNFGIVGGRRLGNFAMGIKSKQHDVRVLEDFVPHEIATLLFHRLDGLRLLTCFIRDQPQRNSNLSLLSQEERGRIHE